MILWFLKQLYQPEKFTLKSSIDTSRALFLPFASIAFCALPSSVSQKAEL